MTTGRQGEFIVLRTLDPVQAGEEFRSIPPHMTELSWFSLDHSQIDPLKEEIDELADLYGFSASAALGTKRVMYGTNEDVPACELRVAHNKIWRGLFGAVNALGGVYKYPEYARNWSPHISDEGNISIQPGERVNFSSLALFSRQDDESGKRKIVEHSAALLGGLGHEATA